MLVLYDAATMPNEDNCPQSVCFFSDMLQVLVVIVLVFIPGLKYVHLRCCFGDFSTINIIFSLIYHSETNVNLFFKKLECQTAQKSSISTTSFWPALFLINALKGPMYFTKVPGSSVIVSMLMKVIAILEILFFALDILL